MVASFASWVEVLNSQLSTHNLLQLIRVAAVIALLGVAAAIATPKGRLPLALRGIFKTLGKPVPDAKGGAVPLWKRLVAFLLLLAAVVLALV